MAGQSARNAVVAVNAINLSTYLKTFASTWTIGLEDTTTFAPTRTAKSWTLLLEETVVALGGFWDATATVGIRAVLKAALARAAQSIVTAWPVGDAVGAVGIAVKADLAQRPLESAVDGVIKLGAEFRSSVGEEDVVSLHAMGQETADGNGTIVDNGAATANGGSAYLEVEDITTDITVTLRHSTDNFVGDDTLLGTFTLVDADRVAERIALTGTIKRYVRHARDLTGNATYRVSLNRNPGS